MTAQLEYLKLDTGAWSLEQDLFFVLIFFALTELTVSISFADGTMDSYLSRFEKMYRELLVEFAIQEAAMIAMAQYLNSVRATMRTAVSDIARGPFSSYLATVQQDHDAMLRDGDPAGAERLGRMVKDAIEVLRKRTFAVSSVSNCVS
jgi:hypothetical protein